MNFNNIVNIINIPIVTIKYDKIHANELQSPTTIQFNEYNPNADIKINDNKYGINVLGV